MVYIDPAGNAHAGSNADPEIYLNDNNDICTATFNGFVVVYGGSGNDSLTIGSDGPFGELYGGAGDDGLNGAEGSDTLDGGTGGDNLNGGDAADFIYGGDGIDTLNGGDGNDILEGGIGLDFINGGNDNDFIFGGLDSDQCNGDSGNDTIYGEEGGDILNGGTGADRMIGGDDGDSYRVDNAGDAVLETAGGGTDTVAFTLGSYALAANVENLFLLSGAVNGTGNTLGNTITGNTAANTLSGVAGNDTIDGFTGNDTIRGGTGKDTLTGGGGRDLFDFNSKSESVKGTNRDVITDLNRAADDRIDLRTIDADTSANPGNDAFKFIGTAAFKGGGGELRYIDHGAVCTVQGDINGDKVADFEIRVNIASLVTGDFFL